MNTKNIIMKALLTGTDVPKMWLFPETILDNMGMSNYCSIMCNQIFEADVDDDIFSNHFDVNSKGIMVDSVGLEAFKEIFLGYMGNDYFEKAVNLMKNTEDLNQSSISIIKLMRGMSFKKLISSLCEIALYRKKLPVDFSVPLYIVCEIIGRNIIVKTFFNVKRIIEKNIIHIYAEYLLKKYRSDRREF